jgi:hypothetical protein
VENGKKQGLVAKWYFLHFANETYNEDESEEEE